MKVLHTSDWHLGRMLCSKKERQEEHTAFLEWLLKVIDENAVDVVLIAGDIFDTASPSSTAQKMYYDFLVRVRATGCHNVVVVGGNHDSPSFLNAPKGVLAALNVAVVGNAGESIEDEIIIIKDENNNPLMIVCAVPFLRERDISRFTAGENYADRSKRINDQLKKHYQEIAALAANKRAEFRKNIPIVATGHLSVLGGQRSEDDGVRETYIGNIEAVSSDIFPNIFDYVALGHYHIPATIQEHIRYCGSPIPLGFGEAGQKKRIYLVEFNANRNITAIEIPTFQKIESVVGNRHHLEKRLAALKETAESVWVEIIHHGEEIFPDFASWAAEQTANSKIEILKLQNRQQLNEVLTTNDTANSLDELDELDVFDKLLDKTNLADAEKKELKKTYQEIVFSLKTDAPNV